MPIDPPYDQPVPEPNPYRDSNGALIRPAHSSSAFDPALQDILTPTADTLTFVKLMNLSKKKAAQDRLCQAMDRALARSLDQEVTPASSKDAGFAVMLKSSITQSSATLLKQVHTGAKYSKK